jgi:hypothetical protein
VSSTVTDTAAERLAGGQPSRTRALLTSMAIGVGATVVAYRLLRGA